MNFKKYHVSKNLFNDFDIIGQVPSTANGNLVNYNDGACTDLIELSSGLLTLSIYETMVVYIFLYDVNKSFLGWVNLSSAGSRTTLQINDYENAKYARVRTDNYSTYLNEKKVMLNEGRTALPYEPYSSEVWHNLTSHIMSTTWTDGSTYSRSGGSWSTSLTKKRSRKKK